MDNTKTTVDLDLEEAKSAEPEIILTPEEETMLKMMIDHHVFYGYSRSKTNPKMKENIVFTKSGVEVIDLLKTMKALSAVTEVIKNTIKSDDLVLFVGTTPAVKSGVKEVATKLDMPYVTERWLGGTLTNFKTISNRLSYFKKLEQDKLAGRLQKYTKKERLGIDVELQKFEKFFRGIEKLEKLPKLLIVTDAKYNEIAAKEASKSGVKSIGFINTNCDPDIVNYPIPGNDRNSKSVNFLLSYLEKAIAEAKKNIPAAPQNKEAVKK